MNKKFSELNCGDSVFIWWINKLYEYPFDHAAMRFDGDKGRHLHIKGGGIYYLDATLLNTEAFIYDIDGWHEYKILGTSKEAVRKMLEEKLIEDKQKLEDNTKIWLDMFNE